MKVPINKEDYSEESKRSYGHESLEKYYKDIEYTCISYFQKAVYSAIEQKEALEVRKEYMWRERVLCKVCWKEMRHIKKKLAAMESEYCENKQEKLNDIEFLEKWIDLLNQYKMYSKQPNTARIAFIEKHLKGKS